MSTIEKISWEEVKELLPKQTSGYYVDQNDSLDERLSEVQEAIQKGDYSPLDSIIEDWDANFDYEKSELKKDLITRFDIDDDQAEEIMNEFEDEINDEMHERDTSTPMKDLFRNTGKQVMFYDTGYEVPPDSWSWNEKILTKERQVIKKKLGLRKLTPEQDATLDMMIRQASYGGKLVIYFYDNPEDYIKTDEVKSIIFTGYTTHIAIINVDNGSGDSCDIGRIKIKLPFNKDNLFLCKTFKYSYTYSVCGMRSSWCESTDVALERKALRTTRKVEESDLSLKLQKDRKYTQVYQDGGCTFGDMDITRHRNTPYSNDYPCGNKCVDCGTFWID